jgi:hypothetical protein
MQFKDMLSYSDIINPGAQITPFAVVRTMFLTLPGFSLL